MPAVVDTLCLPKLSAKIPVKVHSVGASTHPIASLFAEREALGLKSIAPDTKLHKSINDCVMQNLYALGYKPNASSERFLKINLCAIGDPMQFEEGTELQTNYVVKLDECRINLSEPILRLESKVAGLGETVLYWMKRNSDKHCIPGFKLGSDLFQLFKDYRLESCETDEEALSCLQDIGDDEENIPTHLPSAVSQSLGGDLFIKPKRVLNKKDFLAGLIAAEVPNPERLVQLLTRQCAATFKKARAALDSGPAHYWTWDVFDVVVWGGDDQSKTSITGFLDDMDNDRCQNGESDDELFVQRVGIEYISTTDTYIAQDGLQVLAKMFNAWTCLDEILSIITEPFADTNSSKEKLCI